VVEEKKSILSVALDDETFERIAPLLRRESFSVQVVGRATEAMKMAQSDHYHLMICRYPLPDIKLREFVTAIRAAGSASRSSSLLLLTIPEMATEARSGVRGGPYLVFSGQEPLGTLGHGAAHLLQVAPRTAPRITTRLRSVVQGDSETFEAWIVNLSRTGMLVKETPMLPVGSICFFDFTLPNGDTVRGRAEVVRHTKPRRERVTGFGVRFLEFEQGCHEALVNWCEADKK
jgi:CheY-like chemotaxis protein